MLEQIVDTIIFLQNEYCWLIDSKFDGFRCLKTIRLITCKKFYSCKKCKTFAKLSLFFYYSMIILMFLKPTLLRFTVSLQDGLFHVCGDYCAKGFAKQIPFTSFSSICVLFCI